MDVWIVLVDDIDALPFSSEERAVEAARAAARGRGDVEPDVELAPAIREAGWVLYVPYGSEGACVRVVKRTVDDGA
jgi:hypothetical protein